MTKHSVLIIDNDSQALFSAGWTLEQNNYDVTMALNGSSGMEYMENSSFNLVLAELSIDDITGLSLLEAARDTNPGTAIIFQTTAIDPALKEKTFKLGANDFLFKPYQSEELLFRVKKGIESHQVKQNLRLQGGFVTGCCACKKIRFSDNGGSERNIWLEIGDFLKAKMNILLSSTYCPECAQRVQEDLMVQIDRQKARRGSRFS